MSLPPRILSSLPALFLLQVVVACSGSTRWAGSVERRDGVEVVANPGEPLFADGQSLVSEIWSVQGPDWVDPTRVHARGGLVTVVDPPANQIRVVSAAGELLSSLGRAGGGPGEFLGLVDVFQEGNGLIALDGGKGTAEYLNLDGSFRSSRFLDGQPWDGFAMADGTLVAKGEFLSDPTEGTLGDWVVLQEGQEPRAFTTEPMDPLPEEEGVQCSDLSRWGEGAARLRFTTPQIQVFDSDGEVVREITMDLPVQPVTEAERNAGLDALRDELSSRGLPPPFIEQSLVVNNERWVVKCRFGPLRFDGNGSVAAILEQNPEEFGSGNATIHLLSHAGVYLAKASFPTPWEDFALDDGAIYALTRDPLTDLNTLVAYRLDLPQALLDRAAEALTEARAGREGGG